MSPGQEHGSECVRVQWCVTQLCVSACPSLEARLGCLLCVLLEVKGHYQKMSHRARDAVHTVCCWLQDSKGLDLRTFRGSVILDKWLILWPLGTITK